MGTRILTLDFIILCVFSGSKWRQQTQKPLSLGVTAAYISWIVRGFSPPYFVPGYEKVPFFYKIADMRRSWKKTPSSAKYVTKVRPPSVPECPPPPPPPPPPGELYVILYRGNHLTKQLTWNFTSCFELILKPRTSSSGVSNQFLVYLQCWHLILALKAWAARAK